MKEEKKLLSCNLYFIHIVFHFIFLVALFYLELTLTKLLISFSRAIYLIDQAAAMRCSIVDGGRSSSISLVIRAFHLTMCFERQHPRLEQTMLEPSKIKLGLASHVSTVQAEEKEVGEF